MTVAIAPSVVSASAWRHIQTSLTAVLLVVGTGAGIAVAAQAPAVSPVSPPAAVVPAVPGPVTALTGPTPDGVRGNPALHGSGLLAGYLAAVMMLLMARTPVLEHRVGPDVLARWHAVGGRLFLALVMVHAGAAVAACGQDLLTATVSVLGLPWLGAATAGTALFLGVVAASLGRLRRRLSYELWHGLQPGQFFRWPFLTSTTWRSAHPFSLSTVPRGDLLRITVKALGTGSGLVHAVQTGTLVLPEGPSGAMTAIRRSRPSVLLIAGGVEITPMRTLFESLDGADGRVTLLYRASRPGDVIFCTELEDVARRRGGEIIWLVGPSSDPALRMTGANMLRLVPDVADRDVYLCAAPGLSRAVRAALREVGLPARRLHEEAFSFSSAGALGEPTVAPATMRRMTDATAARPPARAAVRRLPALAPPHGFTAAWLLLSAATVAVLCSTGFLPFYDYYQWLFQGHVVAVLLFGADPGSGAIADAYSLSPVPVPNLAAPVVIGLLDTVLPTEVAGRVFVVVTVLGFACAFGHLVRTVQQRATAVEFLGFPWAMGFFLYKGYLSYAFGLALMFVLVATLHRLTDRPAGDHRRTLLAVTGLGVLLYLSHLLAWIMGGLAVLVHALVLARQGRRRTAGQLVATLSPGAVLAVWYLLAERGGTGITLYPSWREKAVALTETLQFFLRSDPFPPALPLFGINVAFALAFVGIVLARLDVRAIGTAVSTRPVLWLSIALAAVALLLPISTVNDLIKPDERFVAPALLLAAAALPYRPGRLRVAALGPALAAAVVALHLVEYVDVGQRIAQVDAATDAAVPAAADVLDLTVPSRYGCDPTAGPVTGVPVLKWFAVDHALEGGPARVNVEETSLVHARRSTPPDATVLTLDVPDVGTAVLPATAPYVEVVACPADLVAVRQVLAPRYRSIADGDTYAILART